MTKYRLREGYDYTVRVRGHGGWNTGSPGFRGQLCIRPGGQHACITIDNVRGCSRAGAVHRQSIEGVLVQIKGYDLDRNNLHVLLHLSPDSSTFLDIQDTIVQQLALQLHRDEVKHLLVSEPDVEDSDDEEDEDEDEEEAAPAAEVLAAPPIFPFDSAGTYRPTPTEVGQLMALEALFFGVTPPERIDMGFSAELLAPESLNRATALALVRQALRDPNRFVRVREPSNYVPSVRIHGGVALQHTIKELLQRTGLERFARLTQWDTYPTFQIVTPDDSLPGTVYAFSRVREPFLAPANKLVLRRDIETK